MPFNEGLNSLMSTSTGGAKALSVEVLDTLLRQAVSMDEFVNKIVMTANTFKKLRFACLSYDGIKIKGVKGIRTVRMRNSRWEVI